MRFGALEQVARGNDDALRVDTQHGRSAATTAANILERLPLLDQLTQLDEQQLIVVCADGKVSGELRAKRLHDSELLRRDEGLEHHADRQVDVRVTDVMAEAHAGG